MFEPEARPNSTKYDGDHQFISKAIVKLRERITNVHGRTAYMKIVRSAIILKRSISRLESKHLLVCSAI